MVGHRSRRWFVCWAALMPVCPVPSMSEAAAGEAVHRGDEPIDGGDDRGGVAADARPQLGHFWRWFHGLSFGFDCSRDLLAWFRWLANLTRAQPVDVVPAGLDGWAAAALTDGILDQLGVVVVVPDVVAAATTTTREVRNGP
jgi:hypothetical protein